MTYLNSVMQFITSNDFRSVVEIITLIALVIYVAKTWSMASATRDSVDEMKQARLSPYVVLYFDLLPNDCIDVVIENIGGGIARGVTFEFKEPLLDEDRQPLTDLSLFSNGIPYLAPHQRITCFYGFAPRLYQADIPRTYEVTMKYKGDLGNEILESRHILDLEQYRGLRRIHFKTIHELTKVMEEVKKRADSVDKTLNKLVEQVSQENNW